MTEVRIRNVDDWVVELHRNRAKLEGHSLENELRQIITDAALAKKQALAAELSRRRQGTARQIRHVFRQHHRHP